MTTADLKRLMTGKKSNAVILDQPNAFRANGAVIESQAADGWEPMGMFGDERDARYFARTASAHYRIVAKAQRLLDSLEGKHAPFAVKEAAEELRKEIRG